MNKQTTKKFERAFLGIVILMTVHIPLLLLSAYNIWPEIDIPMHFFGGFVIGLLAVALYELAGMRGAWWGRALFVIGGAAMVAILWEMHEFGLDALILDAGAGVRTQLSLRDTIGDLAIGLVGGGAAYLVCARS